MNKLVNATLAIALVVSAATVANAQKIGHVNSNDILLLMPERKAAEGTIQNEAKQLETQMGTLNQEYQAKVQDYQAKEKDMTEIVKQDKVKEITDLEERIKSFQQTAQESLQKKEQELLAPMMEKARKAIQEVAKENGFKYIMDTASGNVLYSEPSDDVLAMVKKKLGIDANAIAPSTQPKPAPTKSAPMKTAPRK
jgi:outer membrane protein